MPKRASLPTLRMGPPVLDIRTAKPPTRDFDADVYQTPRWRALVSRLKRERGERCESCGAAGRLIGDHVTELRDGGEPFEPSNVRLMCHPCHGAKTAQAKAERLNRG